MSRGRFFENKDEGNENKIILGNFNCAMDKMERDGRNKTVMPNSNVSNENEATQTSSQTIVEKHDDKKHLLMMPYQGEKGEQVIKSVRKTIKRVLPSNIKVQVSFTGNKLSSCFSIKDKTNFEHRYDVIYLGTDPETICNDNYIGEAKRRIFDELFMYK